jgi:AcrR family transcriptional regulator
MPKVVPGYREQAQERIIKAAYQVFSEKGYHETHMEDISDKLGVSKRTLYIYFKNKEELFKALASRSIEDVKMALRGCFSQGGPENAYGTFFDLSTKGPMRALDFEIMALATRNPALMQIQKERYESMVRLLIQFVEKDFKGGVVPKGFNTERKVRTCIALHRGFLADLMMGANPAEVRQAWIEATTRIMEE